jgi:hypothetical protein
MLISHQTGALTPEKTKYMLISRQNGALTAEKTKYMIISRQNGALTAEKTKYMLISHQNGAEMQREREQYTYISRRQKGAENQDNGKRDRAQIFRNECKKKIILY